LLERETQEAVGLTEFTRVETQVVAEEAELLGQELTVVTERLLILVGHQ
jgi:hypothetical protein